MVESVPQISIVIPAYNEANRIANSLEQVRTYLDSRPWTWEVLVVDDGSADATASVVEELVASLGGSGIRLIRCDQNRGKGAALRTGVAASRGSRVLMMDADLATPIDQLDRLWKALDSGAMVAIGSRAVLGADVQRSQTWLRVMSGRLGNLWIRSLAVPGVHDTQCGFKLFEGEIGRRLFALSQEDRFGIDIEILCLARRRFRLDVAEVGIVWRHQTGSKVRIGDYFDVLVKVPRIAWSVARRATDGSSPAQDEGDVA